MGNKIEMDEELCAIGLCKPTPLLFFRQITRNLQKRVYKQCIVIAFLFNAIFPNTNCSKKTVGILPASVNGV